ncbi:hypothetical protein BCR44DRAFT_1435715 [Catenaria anguillulae PL171]|uniref:Uncharacterized protein n=1 Tax=Catenaria anguillulae PL171 TaxID=765915 RepID=A0A1Y2HLG1_9FUNG|nr:hypothetical protein BCR44DRAFT_1447725 [Catenaria anguillulae PL171]ORZ30298.1 hypothetical protein BCR44DRAFT_1445295 [Catenaria anguillulae PL171]ORZ33513.1 hypothetical protein BCR44DRAFT_1438121 [Catenaria anguillulae PL171]ORZ34664.1 hypothetical protein BCR44DRAFT_1436177 [Catenaria anguillulae PL171]ORZ34671.1 hypothetical protein BCR44DRAFT_1435568 [Catenaria anguillulae PL171]
MPGRVFWPGSVSTSITDGSGAESDTFRSSGMFRRRKSGSGSGGGPSGKSGGMKSGSWPSRKTLVGTWLLAPNSSTHVPPRQWPW